MKILYLANSSIPSRTANSIHVMKICQAFAKNGHEVVLMTPNHSDVEQNIKNPYDFYGVDACFEIQKIPKPRKIIKGLIYQSIVKYLVKSQNPDLVYARCHGLGLYNFTSLGLPIIFEAHRLYKDNPQIAKLIKSKQLRRMIVITSALSQDYQQHYSVTEPLIKVFHDAADEPGKVEKLKLTFSQRLQVGYVGHLYPGKGMEIISELVRRCHWADFHVVGGLEKDIAYWKKELQNCQNIHFYGFLPPSETNKYRQACDVLIAPYQRHVIVGGSIDIGRWMSPLKLFEYMAAGKAILASDLPVLREVLTHSETAWLCPPEDLESWATALAYLHDNPDLRNSLGSRARELFKNKYTWQARAAGVISN
jgi:glycosyltransferase involved in cell wall biosynthesis